MRTRAIDIEMVPLHELRQHQTNTNKHNDLNLRAIRESLLRHGIVEPLVVQKKSNVIIGGNGRQLVLAELGVTEVPVVYVDCDDAEMERLATRLNATAKAADWNQDELAKALAAWRVEDGDDWDAAAYGFEDDVADAFIRTITGEVLDLDLPGEEPPADPSGDVEVVVLEVRIPPEISGKVLSDLDPILKAWEGSGVTFDVA